ncbi:MAG TPA: hypothetical protein VL137_12430 [Polyangiaceae bacterium]|nr:hypothetical protein [Polyangiaceae bacterium]
MQRRIHEATGLAALLAVLSVHSIAGADEPHRVGEPRVMREPAEFTNVIDAFDGDDMFDLQFTLGYQHTWKNASIRRETTSAQPQLSSGGYTATNLEVAKYAETTSRLNMGLDLGIYHDIALKLRLPVILSNDRELTATGGSGANQRINLQGLPGEQLFSLPMTSPTRSGLEYLAVGIDFGLLNQWRDETKPTWVLGLEGRFSVSEPMHACNAHPAAGQVECAEPSDINRNGASDGPFEGTFSGSRAAGVSRGTTGLELHTYLSKRVNYIEPYGGISALFEFQNGSSDYGAADLKGSLVNHPPLQGSMIFGMEIVPWEVLDRFQKLSVDVRFAGTYRSEGRDYSELFDALGSSTAHSLRDPAYAQYMTNPANPTGADPNLPRSIVSPASQKVYTNGITDTQQYGTYSLGTGVTMQAAEYVKFGVGGGLTWAQGHVLTFDQPCNPDFSNDLGAAGPCRGGSGAFGGYTATGIPNPDYRPVIDTPGRRFRVADSTAFDAWLNATVMF